MLLVDVREENEIAVERYPEAVVVPLSSFDPSQIPDPQGKQVVFACRSGRRSVTASQAAQAHGLPYDSHLAGGIIGWKAAGLPTESWSCGWRERWQPPGWCCWRAAGIVCGRRRAQTRSVNVYNWSGLCRTDGDRRLHAGDRDQSPV